LASFRGQHDRAPLQVRQVERALREFYLDSGLIEAGDLEGRPAEERDPRLLSRALTAHAVRIVTGFSRADAALTVIDGADDQGIDAIAVVTAPEPHVYVVQGKWSRTGRANCERPAVLEMANGLRLIDGEDFAPFNPRGRQLAEEAKSILATGPVKVTQVYALMRADEVTAGFVSAIDNVEREFNRYGDMVDRRIILGPEIWTSVRRDLAPPPIEIRADMSRWFSVEIPYESYQGIVQAEQVATWLDHGPDLFNLNIRNPLGRTAINNELISTLAEEPDHFWYFNNGVTVLCESVTRNARSMRDQQDWPLALSLHNASVVNGAQTVRAVAEAVARDPGAGSARVGVRVIVTGSSNEFAKQTTQATNRQNRVEPRDFIALDPVQGNIAEEMRAELGLEYSVRRGERDPLPETGCSVVEAATALACLHADSRFAARIATTLDVLWERGSQGIYDALFRPQPNVYRLWRAVQIVRAVRHHLYELRSGYMGRGAALIDHGSHILSHLVFRRINLEAIDEPDADEVWLKTALDEIPALVAELLPAVAASIDELHGERSQIRAVCSDVSKSREVVDRVLSGVSGESGALIRTKYRRQLVERKRRPNAVTVLVDKAVLAEGDALALAAGSPAEIVAMQEWLGADASRSRATWVAHRTKPILWAADGEQYSPSGLITQMWEFAGWADHPVANQGTARWTVSSGETLAELAWRTLRELELADDVNG
jgi:hypothetical protein